MKKTLWLLALLSISIIDTAAQRKDERSIGTYTTDGKEEYYVFVVPTNKKGDFFAEIEVDALGDRIRVSDSGVAYKSHTRLRVNSDKLEEFSKALSGVREKYVEWLETAKANGVTNVEKKWILSFQR